MLLSWLALRLQPKVSIKRFWECVRKKHYPNVTQEIRDLYEKHCAQNIAILPAYDALFPESLKQLPDCPPFLFVKGDPHTLSKPCIAMVGSRQGSLLAREWTKETATHLSSVGWTIVSGLAKGIDAAAHQGALSTIGVVAGSVDSIYPAENKNLYEMLPLKGCIVSEEPLGVKPQASLFPKRNRIIAGLSQGLVVIEAANASGSLITVKAALEYNRSIFVVPGPPWDTRYGASLKLLREGASLCINAHDILNILLPLTGPIETPTSSPLLLSDLSRDELLSLLSSTPLPVHQLCEDYPANLVMILLTELELEGCVQRIGDSVVKLKT